MIPFSNQDPFPFLEAGSYTYAEAKEHAAQVDQWLGFQMQLAEKKMKPSQEQETWQKLDVQAFQTPYVEIRTILEYLKLQPGNKIIDLGCGYGRMALVVGRHFPKVQFLGYELVSERIQEGQRILRAFSYPLVELQEFDLSLHSPAPADFYFLYDYGLVSAIEKTLIDLREISKSKPLQVVARGRASRFLIHRDHAWLSEVHPPRHYETFSIYQS